MGIGKTSQKITPFLWFDHQAEEAIHFYVSVFPNSSIKSLKRWPKESDFPSESVNPDKIFQGIFTLDGIQFHAIDAGPMFTFNPSISFLAVFESEDEIRNIWNKFIEGGEALMPLDGYPWSELYGWVTDRFGLSWQIMKGKLQDAGQRITPLFMYSGEQRGHAEEAMNFYVQIFKDSGIDGVLKYDSKDAAPEGLVKHAQCRLAGQTFMLMDNGTENDIPFTEAISLFVSCSGQEEVDYYWNRFTEDGSESRCGWLKDKFGVSWQIVPEFLRDKINSGHPELLKNMMAALSQMNKLEVAKLEEAYNNS